MRVIGLAGWSGAGKTTLLVKLIPELARRGIKVSTVKHAHHAFDIDAPGKDSFEHRTAGAGEVLIASARRWALIHELRGNAEPPLHTLLRQLSPADLVIVEGYKACAHPKIEVHRAANGKPFLYPRLANIRAIAADVEVPDAPVPVVPLDNIGAVADCAWAEAAPLGEVIAELERRPVLGRASPAEASGRP